MSVDSQILKNTCVIISINLYFGFTLRIMLKFIVKISLITLFLSQSVQAIEVTKLNEANVAVNSRSSDDRVRGIKQALADVIVKNSGSLESLNNPYVAAQLANPNALLVQYGYYSKDDQLMLRGQFESGSITRMLRKAELPVWGSQRPLVLFWLSTNTNGQRSILNDNSSGQLRTDFRLAASNRGLPLIFPLMDLNDVMKVSEPDVRGGFPSVIAPASARYHADYYVLANLQTRLNGKISYQMNLFSTRNQNDSYQTLYSAQGEVTSNEDAVNSMVTELASYFAQQYAVADTGLDEGVFLALDGVQKLSQLVEIEKNIKQLSVVKSMHIIEIKGDKVLFSVELYGSVADLKRQLNLEDELTAVASPLLDHSEDRYAQDQMLPINKKNVLKYMVN